MPGCYERTPEIRAKQAKASTAAWQDAETKARYLASFVDRNTYLRTPEMNHVMSTILTGRIFSEEHRANMSAAKKGILPSEETKAKYSSAHKAKWQDPQFRAEQMAKRQDSEYRAKLSAARIGIRPTLTEEARRKMSRPRELNPSWRGGTSNEPYPLSFNQQLKETIRIRDGHTCQLCGVMEEEHIGNLNVHHINYNKKDISPMNLISLCRSCNSKVNLERAYYQMLFDAKIKELYE